MENPNNGSQSLADYGSAEMGNQWSWDTVNGWQSIDSQGINEIYMYKGSTLESYALCGARGGTYGNSTSFVWTNW
jgi:hypothetical protein